MCILAIATGSASPWKLVLVANRDEAHARASLPLAEWAGEPDILGGRDQVSGGTWLGVSRHGRLCAVTNLRGYGAPDPAAPSRGALTADFLRGEGEYADPSPEELVRFNPVNFVGYGDGHLLLRTNRPAPVSQTLADGLYGLSNGPFEEPAPKVRELKAALSAWTASGSTDLASLFTALRSETTATPGSPHAGVFVRNVTYGTRCSTVVAVTRGGDGVIAERRFDPNGAVTGETTLTFDWPA
jgi:uncharacterized protein with NRDE domain